MCWTTPHRKDPYAMQSWCEETAFGLLVALLLLMGLAFATSQIELVIWEEPLEEAWKD